MPEKRVLLLKDLFMNKFIVLIICLSCSFPLFSQENKKIDREKVHENFDDFLEKFATDSLFQTERIKFPVEVVTLDDDFNEITKKVSKSNWKMDYIFYGGEKVVQIYDNFKSEIKDTDERLLHWHGIDNGISILYYFKRIDGLWYLIKFEDTST